MRLITRVAVVVSGSLLDRHQLGHSRQQITQMQTMKASLILLVTVLAYAAADAPPIPYTAAVASSGAFPGDHVQAVANQYVDHFGTGGFDVQSGYEGYLVPSADHGFFPLGEGLELKGHGLLSKVLRNLKALGWKVVPKIALGAAVLFALFLIGGCVNALVCSFTPFCTISFLGVGVSKDTMRSYLTPDRLTTTANFVMDAIKKYKDLYETTTNEIDTGKRSGRK